MDVETHVFHSYLSSAVPISWSKLNFCLLFDLQQVIYHKYHGLSKTLNTKMNHTVHFRTL